MASLVMPMFSRFIRGLYRLRWVLAPFFILLFAFCVDTARHLQLRSDFKELLPENYQSVKDMERILERVEGTDSLVIAVETLSPRDAIRFGHDLIEQLRKFPPGYVSRVDFNIQHIKSFFEENKFLYAKLEDLIDIHDRLNRRIEREKIKTTGLYLDLETEEEKEEFSTEDIEEKYKSKTARYDGYIDGYFFGEEGRLMAIVVRPPGAATGITFARDLTQRVIRAVEELKPQSYHPSLKVGLTGKYRRVLFEYEALINDITSTAILVVALVSLIVFLYFLRLRMVFLMGWTVLSGAVWTFAVTQGVIGYLTTQTAFLGAIIVGNGINYSLLLMARYLEERKKGKNVLEALQIAMPATLPATLASSLTTAIAFGALVVTDIRGFAHFGFIGGLGMVACWVATYTLTPVFLAISENIRPIVQKNREGKPERSLMTALARHIVPRSREITVAGGVLSIVAFLLLLLYIPRSIEYDFSKLRVKPKGADVSEEQRLNDRVRPLFTDSMTPAVLVTDSFEQSESLCEIILARNAADPVERQVVEDCRTVFSHVPEEQEEKHVWLKKIRKLLDDSSLEFLNEEQKEKVEEFRREFDVDETLRVDLEDLPEEIIRNYREKDGTLGTVAYVYPTDKAPLWNGKNLIRFADLIRANKLPTGETVTASGTAVIFADLLRAVIHDGPKAALLSFFGVCLFIGFVFRERRAVIFIIGTLLFGVLWMAGLVSLAHIKINFFNFIAIPITFGIGADYGVNIYQRYKLEGKGSIPKVIETTGGAVTLCSLTTIIGYFTLIIAQNQALVSFGWMAILGEFGTLATALVFIPALITRLEQRKKISE